MKSTNDKIEDAIKDGLSNHTGEWFNGFIVPGLNLTEEQSRDLLFYIVKSKRLNDNIAKLIKETLQECIGEMELHERNGLLGETHLDTARNQLRKEALTKLDELLK